MDYIQEKIKSAEDRIKELQLLIKNWKEHSASKSKQ